MAYRYTSEGDLTRAFNAAVAATETMNSLDVDPDVIKARLRIIRELSDALGVDVKIPSNRAVMIRRLLGADKD